MNKKQETKTTENLAVLPISGVPTTIVSSYKALKLEPQLLQETIEANLGDEKFNARSLDVIKMPTGGSTVWELNSSNGIKHEPSFNAVIVGWRTQRTYWVDQLGESEVSVPDCVSDDARTGRGKPGGNCETCPMSEFGSGRNGGQACKVARLLFVLDAEGFLPKIVRLSPTSIKVAQKYFLSLLNDMQPHHHVLTEFSLTQKVNATKQKYAEVALKKVGELSAQEIERINYYRKVFAPILARHIIVTDGAQEI